MRNPVANALVALVYAVAGVAAYASTFDIFFMSDDFDFLGIVAPPPSPLVIFDPLVGRYVRPFVVLMYYTNFHVIGLAPWGYHLATFAPHLVSGWLVYLVARRLEADGTQIWAFLAGLLFLVFSGHSEAVSWPAGIADPLLTVCVLFAFLFYLQAMEPGSSAGWLAAMFAAVFVASLAKEMWVVFPGILVVHAVVFGVGSGAARRRALIAIAGCSLLVLGYLVMRQLVFGSVAGGYTGLGISLHGGIFSQQARAFLLRCFVPASLQTADLWLRRWDLFAWPIAALLLFLLGRGRTLRVLLFAGATLFITLLPVLPLTISLTSTESERFTYLPSAFSCIVAVWAIRILLRQRHLAIVVSLAVIAVHARALVRANQVWEASGTLTRTIVDTFADQLRRHDPEDAATVFILNLPDNVRGAYVFRNGFYSAVQLVTPRIASSTARTYGISTQSLGSIQDVAHVERMSDHRFRLDLGGNQFLQPQIPSAVYYRVERQTSTSYEVEFSDAVERALVLYLTQGRLELAGEVRGPGSPFGYVEIPADGAVCEMESIRFSGWALDNTGVGRVIVSVAEDRTDAGRALHTVLGDATWAPGARPDVARTFAAFPHADRASWNYELPCAVVARSSGHALRVRVVARDEGGRETVLGERLVRAAR